MVILHPLGPEAQTHLGFIYICVLIFFLKTTLTSPPHSFLTLRPILHRRRPNSGDLPTDPLTSRRAPPRRTISRTSPTDPLTPASSFHHPAGLSPRHHHPVGHHHPAGLSPRHHHPVRPHPTDVTHLRSRRPTLQEPPECLSSSDPND